MQMKKYKWLKYILAGVGAIYAVLFVVYIVYATMQAVQEKSTVGPSELELHPERQAEIKAKERAAELKERLNLSDEQTGKVTEIFLNNQVETGPPPGGDPRERFRAVREEIAKILTPEQLALQEQMGPGGPGGPGGGPRGRRPGGPPGMDQERIEKLTAVMTPEQKERFDKQMERMRQRMPFGPGGRRGPGGPGGPGGPPPQ